MERDSGRHPDLPVREQPVRDGELARESKVRGKSPERKYQSHHAGGRYQGRDCQRDVPILVLLSPQLRSRTQSDPDYHSLQSHFTNFPMLYRRELQVSL